MHGVVETPGYLKDAETIFTAMEREAIVTMIALDPECGETMQGTGGVRKVRVGRGGTGKRGGGRVVYTITMQTIRSFCWQPLPRTRRPILVKRNGTNCKSLSKCFSNQKEATDEQ